MSDSTDLCPRAAGAATLGKHAAVEVASSHARRSRTRVSLAERPRCLQGGVTRASRAGHASRDTVLVSEFPDMNMENKMGKSKLYQLLVGGTMGTMVAGGLLFGVTTASAAADCVVSAGVQQNAKTVTGTAGDDTIDCTSASSAKTINGLAGNDTMTGTNFADKINGGDGNDTSTGLGGDDSIIAGEGNNTSTGSAGNDTLTSGAGSDTLTGSAGNDTLTAGGGADTLDGSEGVDTLYGGAGNDALTGPAADGSVDTLNGNAGIDTCTIALPDGDKRNSCELIG